MDSKYIPRNIEDAGGVFGGLFKTRNTIEAIIYLAVVYVFCNFILFFLPFIAKFTIGIIMGLLGGMVFIVGINGQPVSIALMNFIVFKKTKCVVSLGTPEFIVPSNTDPDIKVKSKSKRKKKDKKGETKHA